MCRVCYAEMGVAPFFAGLMRPGRSDLTYRTGWGLGREGLTAVLLAPAGSASAARRGCGGAGRSPGPNRRDRDAAGCGSTPIGRSPGRSLRPCRTRPRARTLRAPNDSRAPGPATEGARRRLPARAGPSRPVGHRSASGRSSALRLPIPARNGLKTEAAPTPVWAVREDASCLSCPTWANNQGCPLVRPAHSPMLVLL